MVGVRVFDSTLVFLLDLSVLASHAGLEDVRVLRPKIACALPIMILFVASVKTFLTDHYCRVGWQKKN